MEMHRSDFERLRAICGICGPKILSMALAQMCLERAVAEETEAKPGYRDRFAQWRGDGAKLSALSDRLSGPNVDGLDMPASNYGDLESILHRAGCRTTVSALAVVTAEWDGPTAAKISQVSDTVAL